MSKFGAHRSLGTVDNFGEALRQMHVAGSPAPVIFSLDIDVWPDVQDFSPSTVVIFRTQPRINNEGYDNPPTMYQGDPIATANDWYAKCKAKWVLNRAHYYAPSNERNPTPEQDAWIDAFDLRLMVLADADGIKLAIHGDSFGTPDYSQWTNYRASLAYAAQHGHIITLHEPVDCDADLTLRYRKVHNLINDFAPGLKMVISECYGDLGLPWVGYVDSFKPYDVEAMKDDYLIGFCAYQLGGAENWAAAIPRWVEWVSANPTPAPEPEPLPEANMITGLHSRSNGGDLDATDKATINLALSKLNGFKFTTMDARANHATIKALGIAPANCIVRLFWDCSGFAAIPSPADFMSWFDLPIREAIADGVVWFEFLNEPNIGSPEWKWSAGEFVTFAKAVIALIKARYPTAKIISPGLSPNAATVPTWDAAFADGGLYAACDGIGAHSYGQTLAHVDDNEQMRYYRRFHARLTGTQKIWITEASLKNYTITPRDVGAAYGKYASTLEDYVAGVYFFVLQGAEFVSSGESWATYQDIARGLAAYVAPPSTDKYVFDYWELDGVRHEGETFTFAMNQDHVLTPHAKKVVTDPAPQTMTLTIKPCPEYNGLTVKVDPEGLIYPVNTLVTALPVIA